MPTDNQIQIPSAWKYTHSIVKNSWAPYKLMVFVTIFWSICFIAQSYPIKRIIDWMEGWAMSSFQDFLPMIFALIWIYIATDLLRFLANYLWATVFAVLPTLIKDHLYEYTKDHSYQFFNNTLSWQIGQKINNVAEEAQNIVEVCYRHIIPQAIMFIILLGQTYLISGRLFLFTVLWAGFYSILNYYLLRKYVIYTTEVSDLDSKTNWHLIDLLWNTVLTKLFSSKTAQDPQFRNALFAEQEKRRNRQVFEGLFNYIINASLALLTISTIVLLIRLYTLGKVSLGEVVLIITMVWIFVDNLWDVSYQVLSMFESVGVIDEWLQVLLIPHDQKDNTATTTTLTINEPEITFENMKFWYSEDKLLFSNFNLHIKPYEKIWIVGKSWAGKTSLVHLLLRLHDIQQWSIFIWENNIYEISLEELRQNISFIPQENSLFHRSILENIVYAKPWATMNEVISACQKAYIHDFIEKLPKWYNTIVWERWVKLSGGQKQRIAIARAILKNSPILILDEATSSLDTESEVHIQKALEEAMQHKTVIAIAHRLSTLRNMDRIIVLDNGNIVEQWNHEELLAQNGIYKSLYDLSNFE